MSFDLHDHNRYPRRFMQFSDFEFSNFITDFRFSSIFNQRPAEWPIQNQSLDSSVVCHTTERKRVITPILLRHVCMLPMSVSLTEGERALPTLCLLVAPFTVIPLHFRRWCTSRPSGEVNLPNCWREHRGAHDAAACSGHDVFSQLLFDPGCGTGIGR